MCAKVSTVPDEEWNAFMSNMKAVNSFLKTTIASPVLFPRIFDSVDSACVKLDEINELQRQVELLLSDSFNRYSVLQSFVKHSTFPKNLQILEKVSSNNLNIKRLPQSFPPPPPPRSKSLEARRDNLLNEHKRSHIKGKDVEVPVKKALIEDKCKVNTRFKPRLSKSNGLITLYAQQNKLPVVRKKKHAKSSKKDNRPTSAPTMASTSKRSESEEVVSDNPEHSYSHIYTVLNKFWALMEPYCAEINEDDLIFLDGLMKRYDYLRTPKKELAKQVNKVKESPLKISHKKDAIPLAKPMKDVKEWFTQEPHLSPFSSLLQKLRVHSSLKLDPHEQTSGQLEKIVEVKEPDADADENHESADNLLSIEKLPNQGDVQTNPKREPIKVSINVTSDSSDEDLAYIETKQQQLYEISRRNQLRLKRLAVLARKELRRQDISRRLAIADGDVLEYYAILESARVLRKLPAKKDIDNARKALRARSKVLKELCAFDAHHF